MIRSLDITDYFRQILRDLEPVIGGEPEVTFKVRLDWEQFTSAQAYRAPSCLVSYQGWAVTDSYSGGTIEQSIDKYDIYILMDSKNDDGSGAILRQIREIFLSDPELLIGDANAIVIVGDGEVITIDNNILLRLYIEVVNA